MAQTVVEGLPDPNPGTSHVTHCPKCGIIWINPVDWNDPESADRCPQCGYRFETDE